LEEAFSADGSVEFSATNQFNLRASTESLGEGSVGAANDADGGELGDFFSEGEEIDDLERLSLESSVEGSDNDDLTVVCEIFSEFDDLYKF